MLSFVKDYAKLTNSVKPAKGGTDAWDQVIVVRASISPQLAARTYLKR